MSNMDLFGEEIASIKEIDKNFLIDNIRTIFQDITLEKLVSLITNELDACIDYYRLTKGENNIMYGKHHTEESKKKMSKPILQIATDGNIVAEYYGATHAHNMTGIHRQTIVSVLKGRGKTAGGFVWKYKEDMV